MRVARAIGPLLVCVLFLPAWLQAQSLAPDVRQVMRADATAYEGDWTYTVEVDPIDDSDRSLAMTLSPEPSGGEYGSLAFKCLVDGLNVMIGWGSYFGGDSDDDVLVVYRFDSEPASSQQYWHLFPGSNEMAWMPMDLVPQFIADAGQHRKVVVRVTDPLDGETKTHTYSLDGAAAMIDRLSCAD